MTPRNAFILLQSRCWIHEIISYRLYSVALSVIRRPRSKPFRPYRRWSTMVFSYSIDCTDAMLRDSAYTLIEECWDQLSNLVQRELGCSEPWDPQRVWYGNVSSNLLKHIFKFQSVEIVVSRFVSEILDCTARQFRARTHCQRTPTPAWTSTPPLDISYSANYVAL